MAGKTGTAQVRNIGADRGRAGAAWRYRDHGLFVFFAPVGAPRYAGAVVIEHGLGGARAAAPVACDVLTYLFDKDRAMARLLPLGAGLGRQHLRADGAPRRGLEQPAARRAAAVRGAGLMALAFVPRPIAALPWRVLWMVIAIAACGALGLYSVAPGGGGGLMPYALPHVVRFGVFLAHGDRPCPTCSRDAYQRAGLPPPMSAVILLLFLVDGDRRGRRRRPLLARSRPDPDPALRADEAGARARPRPLLRRRAAARDQALVGDLAGGLLLVGFPTLLILIQPDLGTAMLIACCTIVMMFLAGLPLWLFIGGAARASPRRCRSSSPS